MDYLRELTLKRKNAHTQLLKMKSKTYQKFLELEESAFAEGELSRKMKELIAVGISAGVGCEPCIQWHTEYALSNGASEQEVLEALEVAMEIGGGKAIGTARLALEVMEKVKRDNYESAGY